MTPSAYDAPRWVKLISQQGDNTYTCQEFGTADTARSAQIANVRCSDPTVGDLSGGDKLYLISRDCSGGWVFDAVE